MHRLDLADTLKHKKNVASVVGVCEKAVARGTDPYP